MRVRISFEFDLIAKRKGVELPKLKELSNNGIALMGQFALEDYLDNDKGNLKIISCEEVSDGGIPSPDGESASSENGSTVSGYGSGGSNGGSKANRPVPPGHR